MTEVWGTANSVKHIWGTFDNAFSTDFHDPTQDLLNDLLHGPRIPHTDRKALWRFANKCRTALAAMQYDDSLTAILNSSQHQHAIAKRLGDALLREWCARRYKLRAERKEVSFSEFCDWTQTQARILSDCEEQNFQSREPNTGRTSSQQTHLGKLKRDSSVFF